jgi:hypothetical protein
MLPTKFRFIWPTGFRGEDFLKSANQNQELPVVAIRNLVGSICGMSSMKIAHFVPIGLQTWPPHAILVSDWSISKKYSQPTEPLVYILYCIICMLMSLNIAQINILHHAGMFCKYRYLYHTYLPI